MNWFKKFMMGRYGGDQLSVVLILLSAILTLTADFAKVPLLALIGYVPLGIALFRMLSKNTSKRGMENYKFAIFISPVYSWFHKTGERLGNVKTHRYFTCPNCKQSLRVPRGKGKITITCPKCKTEFKGQS
ncbi:MAG TPA: hypothetical protein DDW65_22225 [Firmicutes bacterium]|jgi:hypothetical protein|nr:hypothetical protein [Bacillota bacterium]